MVRSRQSGDLQGGPNVSQVAAPAVINLAAMNALTEFTPSEVTSLGGVSVFLPAAWQTTRLTNEAQVWSIPWLAGHARGLLLAGFAG